MWIGIISVVELETCHAGIVTLCFYLCAHTWNQWGLAYFGYLKLAHSNFAKLAHLEVAGLVNRQRTFEFGLEESLLKYCAMPDR